MLELRLSTGSQSVPAGTDAFVAFDGGATSLAFTTSKNGQAIVVIFSVKRSNGNPGGSGRYEVWIDDAETDPLTAIAISNDAETSTLASQQRLIIPNRGDHTLHIRVFAAVGGESISPPTKMLLLGAG